MNSKGIGKAWTHYLKFNVYNLPIMTGPITREHVKDSDFKK